MIRTVVIVYVALVFLALSACQKSDSNNNDATVPAVSADCVNNPSLCQSNLYNTQGYSPYNYGNNYGGGYYGGGYNYYYGNGNYYSNPFNVYNNSSYLCNCPVGSVPTYNSYAGLGCVQQNQIYAGVSAYAYFGWGGGANNQQWTNIPQISNHQGYGQSSCYNGVMQSCLVDQPSTCAVGYSCRSNSAASRVGLCVATNSIGNNGGYGGIVR